MLIITDVETLYRIPDNELKKLTSKDRMVIFSSSGAQMPMSKFQALAAIKVTYIGGCFLALFICQSIFSLCH